ncbi:hypothetical protein PMI14_02187 [Acidovorax sp. CF316]|uniref:hypothetical protein n=1 Tax=Acidovorax sp. CF316 TaxID=1144317 RepID=UPI00026BC307|nr:hypothetical protein [Acidovorax sp. CF316]EJE53113.1 hypothetical protein PMI14_02187 [Acidovorax sp. CF316]
MIYHFHIAHADVPTVQNSGHAALAREECVQACWRLSEMLRRFCQSVQHLGIRFAACEPDDQGLRIWLDTHLDGRSVHNLAESFLSEVNRGTPGLKLALTQGQGA